MTPFKTSLILVAFLAVSMILSIKFVQANEYDLESNALDEEYGDTAVLDRSLDDAEEFDDDEFVHNRDTGSDYGQELSQESGNVQERNDASDDYEYDYTASNAPQDRALDKDAAAAAADNAADQSIQSGAKQVMPHVLNKAVDGGSDGKPQSVVAKVYSRSNLLFSVGLPILAVLGLVAILGVVYFFMNYRGNSATEENAEAAHSSTSEPMTSSGQQV